MKYLPKTYAKAFTELAARSGSGIEETRLVKNFLRAIEKNNDIQQLKKILAETERMLRTQSGRRTITVETARALPGLPERLKHFVKENDILEEKKNPELIAGIKITVNDEEQFDGSLKRKIEKLFM